jgi:hypothetical protein
VRDSKASGHRARNATDHSPSRGSLLAGRAILRFVRPGGATKNHAGDGVDLGFVSD